MSPCCPRSQMSAAVQKICSYQLTPSGWPGTSNQGWGISKNINLWGSFANHLHIIIIFCTIDEILLKRGRTSPTQLQVHLSSCWTQTWTVVYLSWNCMRCTLQTISPEPSLWGGGELVCKVHRVQFKPQCQRGGSQVPRCRACEARGTWLTFELTLGWVGWSSPRFLEYFIWVHQQQGSSENDGRSNVYDRLEFMVISNCCYNNCCCTNCSHFTWIYLIYLNFPKLPWIYLNLSEFTWIHMNLPEFPWISLNCPKFT